MPTRYQLLTLWVLVLVGSAIIEGSKAYLDPQLRTVFIGYALLTIACIVTWIALRKAMRKR
ncbi:MAG TPA: hypothetical protein VNG51_01415 [Ktedonobacteraceae bacterium]|nr:hypothetical protein [Ktedonobacteraceae bacterium]